MTKPSAAARALRSRKPAEAWQEERIEVVEALLNRPFIRHSKEPELYNKARDYYRDLRDWFHEQTGWPLILTRQFVKLEKTPVVWQPWMRVEGLRDGRDYGLFTYGLWYLEGLGDGDQFLLTEMVEAIRDHLLAVDIAIDWTLYDHRLAMSRALKKLRDLEVIAAVEGDEADWAKSVEGTNVLYEASPLARYMLRRFPRDLMSCERIADLNDLELPAPAGAVTAAAAERAAAAQDQNADPGASPRPASLPDASDSAAVRARRHRVMRRLLQEPVVYDWQWDESSLRYVQTQRASLLDRMQQWTGLVGHRYREALVFTWPELTGPMDLFPTQATLSDIVMLVGAELRAAMTHTPGRFERDSNGSVMLTRSELEGLMLTLRERAGSLWSKEFRDMTGAELARQVLLHLEEWNLGARTQSGALLYPGLVRWHGYYETDAEDAQ